jgi:hypothetical protein
MEAAQCRIRQAVCRVGMASRWHIGKATDILHDHGLLERYVVPLEDDEAAQYLASLPERIEQARQQDARCARLWASRHVQADLTGYAEEQRRLEGLLSQFQFPLRSYERLVRQERKPLLEQATRLLAEGRGETSEALALEAMFRMTLQQFVDLERGIAAELCVLDEARAELVAAHEAWAREKALSCAGSDPEAPVYAARGLRKAAEYFEYRRGYRFATYARHWIERAIRDKRTWQG